MDKRTWMQNEIAAWRAEGLVDAATAERLEARYAAAPGRLSWGILLAGVFGAFLVGLGVIALVAANWAAFGRAARTALAFAPVAACGAAALLFAAKEKTSAAVMEPMGLLWFAAVAAGATIVAQTYQIGDSVAGLLLFIAVLALPVLFAVRAFLATTAWTLLATVWVFEQAEATGESWTLAWGAAAGIVALSAAALAVAERSRPQGALKSTGRALLGTAWALGVPCMLLLAAPLPFIDFEYFWLLFFWGAAAALWGAGWFLGWKEWRVPAAWVGVGASATAFVPAEPEWLRIPLYAAALVHAAVLASGGIRRKDLWHMNAGALLGAWLVLAKFFASDVSFTVKGVVLIAAGVAILLLNCWMVRMKKREAVR